MFNHQVLLYRLRNAARGFSWVKKRTNYLSMLFTQTFYAEKRICLAKGWQSLNHYIVCHWQARTEKAVFHDWRIKCITTICAKILKEDCSLSLSLSGRSPALSLALNSVLGLCRNPTILPFDWFYEVPWTMTRSQKLKLKKQ